MKVLVCGGRDYNDWEKFRDVMDKLCWDNGWHHEIDQHGNWLPNITVIHGGAKGADSLADEWAVINWCKFEEYKADWDKDGKAAGPVRNQRMLDQGKPDLVVSFPGGRGTADMIGRAKKSGVPVMEIANG